MPSTEFTNQPTHHVAQRRSLMYVGATVALLAALIATPTDAMARPDPGKPVMDSQACGPSIDPRSVPVTKLGNHLVRCDYLVR
jgi:hypothetical protein